MANYDLTPGGANYKVARSNERKYDTRTEQKVIDFAADFNGTTNAAADYAKIMSVAIGDMPLWVTVQVITASTTTGSTFTIGDNTTATAYKTATSATATGYSSAIFTTGTIYSAADNIRLVLGTTAPKDGKICVSMEFSNIQKPE